MKIHNLKILPIHFYQVENRFKKVELRKNDRDYKDGDTLCLEEWCPYTEQYTGKECNVKVTHILQGGNYGLEKDYVAMSIEIIK
ncbi:DUF3850 domain-containing protein [Tenacibaculum caenipelagi]|uniref:Uncharacterized protein DUF3850 n=1 Tax=Tenacibaculum caenipelagi TaxID=1325435 RepID=A0A4R6TCU2_9FLAO|nr:DUF3850 domain-containing protein [Tenacibaculum caenipelagi]TDQ22771.1 uncharacterized protein DUF3850 [Tenacibaculum caenipelagi]